jgi:DNA-binding GntR family transcriptional regulator
MPDVSQAFVDTEAELSSSESSAVLPWPDSLVGSIAKEIAADIVAGRLSAGHDLNSVDLARRFETSRTPIREALLLLEKEGLVEIELHRRPRVRRWTWTDICELYHVRAALSALISELIVENATDEQIEVLAGLQKHLAIANEAFDIDTYLRIAVSFRETEMIVCGNSQLALLLKQLELRTIQLRRYAVSQPDGMHESCVDCGRLVRAYQERDAKLAFVLRRSFVLRGLERIRRFGWKEME